MVTRQRKISIGREVQDRIIDWRELQRPSFTAYQNHFQLFVRQYSPFWKFFGAILDFRLWDDTAVDQLVLTPWGH